MRFPGIFAHLAKEILAIDRVQLPLALKSDWLLSNIFQVIVLIGDKILQNDSRLLRSGTKPEAFFHSLIATRSGDDEIILAEVDDLAVVDVR